MFSLKFIHVDTYLYNYPDLYLIDVVQLSLISVIDFTYKSMILRILDIKDYGLKYSIKTILHLYDLTSEDSSEYKFGLDKI